MFTFYGLQINVDWSNYYELFFKKFSLNEKNMNDKIVLRDWNFGFLYPQLGLKFVISGFEIEIEIYGFDNKILNFETADRDAIFKVWFWEQDSDSMFPTPGLDL